MAENASGPPSTDNSKCVLEPISISKSDEKNSSLSADTSKWLAALETYVKETENTCLDFEPKRIGIMEAAEVYKFLSNSQIIDLNLSCNKLRGGMEDLIQSLVTSKINTLSFCRCIFSNEELLRLMAAVKNTQITELIIDDCQSDSDEPIEFDPEEGKEFISHLLKTRLTVLGFQPRFMQPVDDLLPFSPTDITPLLDVLPGTVITNLDLSNTTFSKGVLASLFSTLSTTAITDLALRNSKIDEDELEQLSLNLKDSKLEILDLSTSPIEDSGVNILAVGLAQSKITELNLSETLITGACSLELCLKDSKIRYLNISCNSITSENLFSFPDFLKLSVIETLDMTDCQLEDELSQKLIKSLKSSKVSSLHLAANGLMGLSVSEFSEVLRDTNLTYVDFSHNFFPSDGAVKLGNCLKDSKLETIKLNSAFSPCCTDPVRSLSDFFEKTKDTSVKSVEVACHNLDANGIKTIAANLVNTTFLHLDLTGNHIGDGIVNLAPQLKFTTVTQLHLGHSGLKDAGVETLANYLRETKIIYLDLHHNGITNSGAKVLAAALKGTKVTQMQLAYNQIENEGLEALAEHIKGTFVTVLNVKGNPGNRNLLIDRILLENLTAVHHFVSFFKQIAPQSDSTNFCFDDKIDNDNENVDAFLEKCLVFYRTVMEQSSAVNVLMEGVSTSFSKDQILTLLDEFPRQFTLLVLNKIEASASQHVDLLKKAEELKLTMIVEFLLLNRPALTIDQNANILHPYVYQLLHKYKQPLYNLSIEPEGKIKIIEYFTEHSNLEGAIDVLSMLCDDLTL